MCVWGGVVGRGGKADSHYILVDGGKDGRRSRTTPAARETQISSLRDSRKQRGLCIGQICDSIKGRAEDAHGFMKAHAWWFIDQNPPGRVAEVPFFIGQGHLHSVK